MSEVDQDTDPSGSPGWIVEGKQTDYLVVDFIINSALVLTIFLLRPRADISLFSTTIRFGSTREVATVSNGSIARCKIINANRSDKAQLLIYMKFGVDVPLSKVVRFKSAVHQFIQDRPREFLKSVFFRLTRVETDLGFVEYVVVVQCRDSWQKITSVLESKAKVSAFCLEVQKKLDMRYISPPMPVNLSVEKDERTAEAQRRDSAASVRRRTSQARNEGGSPPPTRGHRTIPSMGDKISAIAELFGGDTKKSR